MAPGRSTLGGVVVIWLSIGCDEPHYCEGALTCDAGDAAAHASDAGVNPIQPYASGNENSETTTDEPAAPAVSGEVCGSMTTDMGGFERSDDQHDP